VVVDRVGRDNVFGKIFKLRMVRPKKINRTTGEEAEISLLDEENIIETSHFIYYIIDKIILGEYNFHGVRHLIRPLKLYFEKRFDIENVRMSFLPDENTFELMRRERVLKKFTIRLARENLSHIEKTYGISLLRSFLGGFTKDDHSTIEITISKSRKHSDSLDTEKVIEATTKLKEKFGKEGLEQLKIEGENATYDILNDNTYYFSVALNTNQGAIDSQDFYSQADVVYNNYKQILINTYKTLRWPYFHISL